MSASSRGVKRIMWIGGLALVLALFAHDALMAGIAHATPASHQVPHQPDVEHHVDDATENSSRQESAPVHPEACGFTGEAIPTSSLECDPVGILASVLGDASWRAPRSASRQWVEPFGPPGARRAWLQVYRI